MCHSTWNGPRLTEGYDAFAFRRTTLEQFYTSAHLAYAQGADGVSAFNFVYYREHGGGGRGPFAEPPFEVFAHLHDPQWLARQPQHWFIAPGWRAPGTKPTQVPRKLEKGKPVTFIQELAPPTGGWKKGGRLRIQSQASLRGSQWNAHLNGHPLLPSEDLSEPYTNPYPPLLGTADEMRSWIVPADILRDGTNRLELTLESGTPTTLVFIDLALS